MDYWYLLDYLKLFMPVITSIKPQKNKFGGTRVNIYLDDKFGFGLDLQTLLKEGLKVNQELSEKEIETIVKQSEFQTSYDKILRFATMRPRSEKEFEDWLAKHKVHESLKEELFNRLKRLQLLDDKKFASWWIEQRQSFRPKSKKVLSIELRVKGISKEIIDNVFAEEKIDEKFVARQMLQKKEHLWKELTGFEKRKKMFGFLIQRGFNTDIIREILGEFQDDSED